MYENLYETITQNLVDYGYIIINDALDTSLVKNLQDLALQNQSYKQAGISNTTKLHLDDTKRRDKTKWLDEDGSTQSAYLSFTKGLQEYLNSSLYLGLCYYEAHFALYEEGDFYEKHLDSFKNSKNRVVTTVFYLNEAWKEDDGGELIIYDKDDTVIAKVMPEANTLVVFLSEDFPHEVLQAKRKRHSIAGWFRVDKKFV
jgi:SM-20-related protein